MEAHDVQSPTGAMHDFYARYEQDIAQARTMGAWREAMLARGYTMPLQLCHGLSQAMTHLKLTFPEAFRLLWDNEKIIVAGLSLINANSASTLWAEGKRPPSTPPASRSKA